MPLRYWVDEELIAAVRDSVSLASVMQKLGISGGGSRSNIKKHIERLHLDTSHFTGQLWSKGRVGVGIPIKYLLVDGRKVGTNHLRKRLINEGIKEAKCEICGLTDWLGKPAPLELDHIDGDKYDNRLENLRILCPNCHAQTDTYRGKNKELSRFWGIVKE